MIANKFPQKVINHREHRDPQSFIFLLCGQKSGDDGKIKVGESQRQWAFRLSEKSLIREGGENRWKSW